MPRPDPTPKARAILAVAVVSLFPAGLATAAEQATKAPRRLTVAECVAIALKTSGQIVEAEGKVDEWKGRLAEVQSIFYPKLTGMGFVAPMFRVKGSPDIRTAADVDRDYSRWGPYFHLDATLAQPIFTFGRAAAGKRGMSERIAVEQARVRQTRNVVALEVRKLYYLHLYAKTMRPALESARQILDKAQKRAQEEYDDKTGKVTNVDLMKLAYASAELDRYRIQAEIGEDLALAALKHTMGMPQDEPVMAAEDVLPDPPEGLPALAALLKKASENRPEWAQLEHGQKAALSLEEAEKLANAPTVFAAGQIRADWTPMRPNIENPYFWDPYNQVVGGLAVGLLFDLDPIKAKAKVDQARGLQKQIEGLRRFAATGIPIEVRRAHDEAMQAKRTVSVAEAGAVAARKWMIFAGAAFATGTGEARDLLEGLAAYLLAKRGHYESLQGLHVSIAQIMYATGETGVPE